MSYLRVKNWEKFQHADATKRGRDPIWIKNYTRLLHDDAYLDLSLSQRGLLHGIWLLRASTGRDPSEATTRRLLSTNKAESRHFQANLAALEQAGFIEICQDSVKTVSSLEERREENKEQLLPVDNSVETSARARSGSPLLDTERVAATQRLYERIDEKRADNGTVKVIVSVCRKLPAERIDRVAAKFPSRRVPPGLVVNELKREVKAYEAEVAA